MLWRHCHTHDCEVHDGSVFPVVIGDAFHNFVDGAAIAAAVMTSVPLGVSMAVAVAAHEIPQEVGDFAILLHAGYSRSKALLLNVLSAFASALSAVAAYFAFELTPRMLPYFLALAAASFLYVAMADLIPRPSPRQDRCGLHAADPPDRRWRRHDARPVASSPEDDLRNHAVLARATPLRLTPRRWQSLCPVNNSGGWNAPATPPERSGP